MRRGRPGPSAVALVNVIAVGNGRLTPITDHSGDDRPGSAHGFSTRLKAGTAQKLVLNLLTTAAMVRLGKVYGNLMVDVRATNVKLRDRAIRIVQAAATTADREQAQTALEACEWHCKTAIVMLECGLDAPTATQRLQQAGGWVRAALSPQS